MTSESNTQGRVESALAGLIVEGGLGADRDGTVTVRVAPADVHKACKALRDQAGFETNTFVTARDHGIGKAQRFEIFYQFLSYAHGDRVRLSTLTEGDSPSVPSVVDLWPGVSFSERECWDMFGVRFEGHPDLRRLLMPEGFTHHPLRKDFPHIGIEPDRLFREWDDARRAEYAAQEAERKGGH